MHGNAAYSKAFVRMIILLLASVAAAMSAPITLELSGERVIKGDLVFWNGQQAGVYDGWLFWRVRGAGGGSPANCSSFASH